MKNYIGTKHVLAEPMNELTAVEKGCARKNEDNHEWRNGYHVRYSNPDGSTYDSWSPDYVFEASYKCADTFLDRLIIEQEELHERIDKLTNFLKLESRTMNLIGQLDLLHSQLNIMQDYERIILKRLSMIK